MYCRSGTEAQLGKEQELERRFASLKTLVAVQEKHRIVLQRREIVRRVFFPGYLFLYSTEPIEFAEIRRMAKVHRVLGEGAVHMSCPAATSPLRNGCGAMRGGIGISNIQFVDGVLKVHFGPMQYFFEDIVRLDKHTRNALVRMNSIGKRSEIWLVFKFADEEEERKVSTHEGMDAQSRIAVADRGDAAEQRRAD